MAEQTVRYRVELDDADLAQQLESIRNRLSEGVASYPNNLIQQPIPTFDQSQIYTAPLAYTPVSMPEQGNFPTVNVPNMLFNMPDNSSTGYQMATNNFTRFRENASTGFEQVRVSSSEFVNNINAGSEMAFNNVENFGVKSSSKGMSLWDSGAASFGIGYDASMPVFRSDYKDFYSQEFASNAKSTIASGIENTITFGAPIAAEIGAAYFGGAAAAAVVGGVGTLAALPVAVGLIGAETKMEAIEQTSDNLFNIAMYTPAKMSKVQAESIATSLYDYTKTDEANLKNLDIEDLNAVIVQFGAAGGFSKTTDVASFTQKTTQLIQNFREFMHALNMAQEDAAALMGELEAKGISTVGNAPVFAAQMQVQASQAGMPTNDLISYGLQMGDMLKSEGFNPMQGFDFAVDARTEMNRLLNSNNPYYKNAIYQAGGVDAATNNLMRFLGSSSGGGSVYDFNDYTNNPSGNNPGGNNADTATQPDDYFKLLEDAAAMFSSDPLSVFKMLSVDKQVEATIGIKQRAQRNVSQALVGLNMVGYSKDKLSPQDIVGMMMTQAGGKLDAATAWQTYGLATSFTDYEGLSDQVNQLIATNSAKEEDYSLGDVLHNYFLGENSLLGAAAGVLTDAGVAAKNKAKSWSSSLVNGYEDIVDAATGKKRIHYEDFKNLSPDQFSFNKVMEKAYMENRVSSPITGNTFTDRTLSDESALSEQYEKDFLLKPGTPEDNAKIDAAFNFKDMHPFLRRLGIETFRKSDLSVDKEAFNDYSNYVHQVMTENGGSVKVAGVEDILENLSFSGHLQNLGLGDKNNYSDKNYLQFRDNFMTQLNDKTKSNPMGVILDPSPESYYDALSLRRYGKSFDSLDETERTNIHTFATDKNGGIKYLQDSGDLPGFLVDTVLPFMSRDVRKFDNDAYIGFTESSILNSDPDNLKKQAMDGYGFGTGDVNYRKALTWLDSFQNYGTVFNEAGNKDLFNADYAKFATAMTDQITGGTLNKELSDLNNDFKNGNIDFTKLEKLYTDALSKPGNELLLQTWQTYSPEQKAAYIAKFGASGGLASDTNEAINSTLEIKNDSKVANVKLGEKDELRFEDGKLRNMSDKDLQGIFAAAIESGANLWVGSYEGGYKELDMEKNKTLKELRTLANDYDDIVFKGGTINNHNNTAFKLMKELGMGYFVGDSFNFKGDFKRFGALYDAAATGVGNGMDFILNRGLFFTQEQERNLNSADLLTQINAEKEVQKLNETGMSLDMATSLALNTKIGTEARAQQINTIATAAADQWLLTDKGKELVPDANKDDADYKKKLEELKGYYGQVVQGKEAQAKVFEAGMKPTNDILIEMKKVLAEKNGKDEGLTSAINNLSSKIDWYKMFNINP